MPQPQRGCNNIQQSKMVAGPAFATRGGVPHDTTPWEWPYNSGTGFVQSKGHPVRKGFGWRRTLCTDWRIPAFGKVWHKASVIDKIPFVSTERSLWAQSPFKPGEDIGYKAIVTFPQSPASKRREKKKRKKKKEKSCPLKPCPKQCFFSPVVHPKFKKKNLPSSGWWCKDIRTLHRPHGT
jgi:hypothetical protein